MQMRLSQIHYFCPSVVYLIMFRRPVKPDVISIYVLAYVSFTFQGGSKGLYASSYMF